MSLTQVLADSVNTSTDFTFTGNVIISGAGGIVVNPNTPLYFANGYNFDFSQLANVVVSYATVANAAYIAQNISDGASINVSNITISGAFYANNSTGSNGQVLVSNTSGVYWSSITGLPSVNTTGQTIIYDGNNVTWHSIYTYAGSPPPNPNLGDIWYYDANDKMYMWIYDGTNYYWLDFLPSTG